jgi:prevent-host-death family protein
MAVRANIHEAKTRFSELLERAHRGEEIIIAKAGKPYAKLVPVHAPGKRTPGAFRGLIAGDVLGGMGPDDADWG